MHLQVEFHHELHMIFSKNNRVFCRILNYIPKERSFEVEEINTRTKGRVIFVNHYDDIPSMRDAFKTKKIIPLYFDRYENNVPLFSYKIYNEIGNNVPKKAQAVAPLDLTISLSFSPDNAEYNVALFDVLYNSLGNHIDSEEKYSLAKQLFAINRALKIRQGFTKELFNISNSLYQTKFWNEGLIPYFSNIGVKKSWMNSDDEGKQMILQRLGIELSPQKTCIIETFFENIEEVVLKNIIFAKSSIYACMAWFTNFNIFKAIRKKLDDGVKVVLLTNNDLINNGGYCLDFNALIKKGLELHLAEYPELIHHKFCVLDDQIVMTGSYNWTFFSENINRENMILIKDDNDTIQTYLDEFNMLIKKYPIVSEMPESVPEKPEYDRSSFKQYISEELVLRSKKRIGNIKDNIISAKRLSPMYKPVLQAISEFNIVEDNSSLTIEQIEHTANLEAIAERRKQINTLNQRQQTLSLQRENLEIKRQQIAQQQDEIAIQVQHVAENENISEEERTEIQANIRLQAQELEQRQEEVESNISQVNRESSTIEEAVSQTEAQIVAIQNTAQIVTEGGRGSLKINLKWNTYDDLDLHVIDPDDVEICYSAKEHRCQNILGKLDIDANAGGNLTRIPQENIFWEEGKNAPIGRYKVFVVYYSKKDTVDEIPFTVTVYPEKGNPKVFTDSLRVVKDQRNIVEFNYTENGISYNL